MSNDTELAELLAWLKSAQAHEGATMSDQHPVVRMHRVAKILEDTIERAERAEKLDREAATHVESVLVMRTHFTGEPPYVGWEGLGRALNETLDRLDYLERTHAKIQVYLGHQFLDPPDGGDVSLPEQVRRCVEKAYLSNLLEGEKEFQRKYANREAARAERLREALDKVAESRDAGRHDGKPEPCPAYSEVEIPWLIARQAVDEDDKVQS